MATATPTQEPRSGKNAATRRGFGQRLSHMATGFGEGGSHDTGWLWRSLWKSSPLGMIVIGLLEWLGSISAIVSLVSLLLVVRSLDTGQPLQFRGFELFSLDNVGGLAGFVAVVAAIGVLGGLALIVAEQRAGTMASELIAPLRAKLIELVDDPGNARWEDHIEGRAEVHLHQVVVSDLRDVALAARMMLLILGPAATASVSMSLMVAASWQLSLLAVPFGLLVAIPLRRQAGEAEDLQRRLAVQRNQVRDLVVRTPDGLDRSMADEQWAEALERVEETDGTLNRILNSPARVRAMNQAALVTCGALALLVGRSINIDVAMLILFVFCLRFLLGAIQRVSGRTMAIARHGEAIDRYMTFKALLEDVASIPEPTETEHGAADIEQPSGLHLEGEAEGSAAAEHAPQASVHLAETAADDIDAPIASAEPAGPKQMAIPADVVDSVTSIDLRHLDEIATRPRAISKLLPAHAGVTVEVDPLSSKGAAEPPPPANTRFAGPSFDAELKASLSERDCYGLIFGDADAHQLLEFPAVSRLLVLTDRSLAGDEAVNETVALLDSAWFSSDGHDLATMVGPTYRHHYTDDTSSMLPAPNASAVHPLVLDNPAPALRCRLDRLQLVLCSALTDQDLQETVRSLVAASTNRWSGVVGIRENELCFAVSAGTFAEATPQSTAWL